MKLEKVRSLSGHLEDRVWHISWSHSGKYLASCGEDRTIMIWGHPTKPGNWDDIESISCICSMEEGQQRTIRCCEWDVNDRYIASASFDGSVAIWERKDERFKIWRQCANLEGHESEVKSLSWNFDGSILATCGRDKKVWLWENVGANEFECIAMFDGHSQDVKFVRFHPTLNILYSCSYDDLIKVWRDDGDDWYCTATLAGHKSTVWGIAPQCDCPRLISCSDDRSLIVWECDDPCQNTKDWRMIYTIADCEKFPIYSVDWSYFQPLIIAGGAENSIELFSFSALDGLSLEDRHQQAHESDVNCVRWNQSEEHSHLVASCGDDGLISIWQLVI